MCIVYICIYIYIYIYRRNPSSGWKRSASAALRTPLERFVSAGSQVGPSVIYVCIYLFIDFHIICILMYMYMYMYIVVNLSRGWKRSASAALRTPLERFASAGSQVYRYIDR